MGTPTAATPGKRLKLSRDDGTEDEGELVAIKKFKPDKEGEAVTYTGISQSACREIMVGRWACEGLHWRPHPRQLS